MGTVNVNFGAATAIANSRYAATAATRSIANLADGKDQSRSNAFAAETRANGYAQGAKNVAMMAGRYEQYAANGNAIMSVTQQMLELATKYSGTGYNTSEIVAAGALYVTLDAYRGQLSATPALANSDQVAFNAAKTESVGAGYAVIAATTIGRAWTIGSASTVSAGGVTGTATLELLTDVDAAGNLASKIVALTAEVDNIAASTASLAEAATVFNAISLASGYKSAGYSAAADAAGVDFAAETARLASAQIKAQAANAMVAQAGVVKQTDLALLQ